MSPSELAVVVPIVAASISFFAAIAAVIIGQNLGQRAQRVADQRRWDREDSLRRRTRSEEMARRAVEELAKASDLVGWRAGRARGEAAGRPGEYLPAEVGDISALCRPVRRAALEIEDEGIRSHLEDSCNLLPNCYAIERFGSPHPGRVGWAVQQTSEALISAYLRGSSLPAPLPDTTDRAFKVFRKAYSAMEDLWSEYDDEED